MTRAALVVSVGLLLLFSASSCTVRGPAGTDPFDANADSAADASASACRVDSECADRFACTIDHCTAGACVHMPCTDCCGAGFMCDGVVGCTRAADPCTHDSECMDDQPCTLDRCRDGRVCEHQPMDSLCPFGQICIGSAGCIPEPPDHCTTDADCEAIGFCYGVWDCATELGCAYVGPRNCDDSDTCTADRCDAAAGMCAHDTRDADLDTYTDDACSGNDCDDAVATTHPGATEACNGVDDDCDTTVDEGCCAAGPCTTSCGTTGMTSCLPDGTVGPCMAPAEICDGNDQDCDALIDETFDCARSGVSACMTSCGSMGMATCDATCHLGACTPPVESCNAADDDCDGAADDGFACVRDTSMACPTTCGSIGSRLCGGACTYDLCAPPPETCNGVDDNCNLACDEGFACCAGAMTACSSLGFFSGMASCRGDCTGYDTATCTNCGNGTVSGTEQCDGVDLAGQTCASRGFAGGILRCAAGCMFDTSSCSTCGNGTRQGSEQCDGADLGGTCGSIGMGFGGGMLSCRSDCTYNTSLCSRCGNGMIDGTAGEQCDGALLGGATCASRLGAGATGTLGCGSTCLYDTSMCTVPFNPTGTWVVTPGVNLYCAFGAVSISFGNLTFTDTGSALSVSGGGINCTMTGASARATRMFDVSCMLPGGCNETYRLVGTFPAGMDNAWSGTFTATFTGSGCAGCSTRTFSGISGSR